MFVAVGKKTAKKVASKSVDEYVGGRVRLRRRMLNMSQGELGDSLGISCQQIQKYENGANRISASRLQRAAHILQVPIPFFFEGAPGGHNLKTAPPLDYVDEFVSSSEGLRLISAFVRIDHPETRRRIVSLVQVIAEDDGDKD